MSELMQIFRGIFQTKARPDEGSKFMSIFVGVFAAFSGMLMGYDTGTISGILAMDYVLERFPRTLVGKFTSTENGLIVSILSLGTFVGAMVAPAFSDRVGRRWCIIVGTLVFFNLGTAMQTASTETKLLIAGRFFAGFGVGITAAVVPLYQSETVPKNVRGAIVSLYQFAFAFGLVLATIIINATHKRNDSGSYRIPIAVQHAWALIIGIGFLFLPETPRFYVTKNRKDKAFKSLSILRMLPIEDSRIEQEYDEIKANYDYEMTFGEASWKDVFTTEGRQLKRIIAGAGVQAFQQLTGINFVFYYGVTFFKNAGIKNSFVINIVCNLINCVMTIPGMICVEVYGRRPVLLVGSAGMAISDFIISITSVAAKSGDTTNKVMIAFICIFIGFFGLSFGPIVWVICGEIFPLKVRAKSMGVATASNWLWNFAIAYATPYLVDDGPGNAGLGAKVYFIWGACNILAFLFTFVFVYETKNLKLEEVDELYETHPHAWRTAKFAPTKNYNHKTELVIENVKSVEAKEV